MKSTLMSEMAHERQGSERALHFRFSRNSGHCAGIGREVPRAAVSNCSKTRTQRHDYSITLSATATSLAGTSRVIAFTALRLITSSNLVGCSTGSSEGPTLENHTDVLGGAAVTEAASKPSPKPDDYRASVTVLPIGHDCMLAGRL